MISIPFSQLLPQRGRGRTLRKKFTEGLGCGVLVGAQKSFRKNQPVLTSNNPTLWLPPHTRRTHHFTARAAVGRLNGPPVPPCLLAALITFLMISILVATRFVREGSSNTAFLCSYFRISLTSRFAPFDQGVSCTPRPFTSRRASPGLGLLFSRVSHPPFRISNDAFLNPARGRRHSSPSDPPGAFLGHQSLAYSSNRQH